MRYIYCYTNKINNHKYVGQTNNIKRRKNEHKSNSLNINSPEYNILFHKKLRQYGEENFDFTILEEGEWTIEETNQKEIYWIDRLKTFVGDNMGGYNLTRGGNNNEHSVIYSKDIIQKVKEKIKQGISYEQIHNEFDISISYISEINSGNLHYDNKEIYPLYKYYQLQEELDEIIDLLKNSSLTLKEIAEKTEKAYSTIKKINSGALHHKNDITYPIRKENTNVSRAKKIQQLLLQGKSDKEIMQLTGASITTVKRINKGETHHDDTLNYPLR